MLAPSTLNPALYAGDDWIYSPALKRYPMDGNLAGFQSLTGCFGEKKNS